MKKVLQFLVITLFAAVVFAGVANATAIDLIQNGDFEQGSYCGDKFPGWEVSNDVDLGCSLLHPLLKGMDGKFALLGSDWSSGESSLSQEFVIPEGVDSFTLSFDWAFKYWDVSKSLTDTLFVLYQPGDGENELAQGYSMSDLLQGQTPYLGHASGTFSQLIEVGCDQGGSVVFTLNESDEWCWLKGTQSWAGIDNVKAIATTKDAAPVPEPASMILLGSGLLGAAAFRRKKG